MTSMNTFKGQTYINLETFRKNGLGMKTPVWFVQDGDTLFVRTVADCGKIKRLRANGRVNIAPCKGNGDLLGDWAPAEAREVKDETTHLKVDRLLGKKYGLMKTIFAVLSRIQGRAYTVVEIKLSAV
jgi:PPOX class probable F420-dependent enzyme